MPPKAEYPVRFNLCLTRGEADLLKMLAEDAHMTRSVLIRQWIWREGARREMVEDTDGRTSRTNA